MSLRTVHFAPFAPHACGLYEAARDMVVADHKAGHDALLVDVGPMSLDGKQAEAKPGQKDHRGDVEIISATPNAALNADILVYHTGVSDSWVVKNQAPIIFIVHGRPASCFAMEQKMGHFSYSLTADIAGWPRVKALVSFWPYHKTFWEMVVPKEKLFVFSAPPIDEVRFCAEGNEYDFADKKDKWNIVIADCWREDVNTFEILNGAIEAARRLENVKFHIFAMSTPVPQCWWYLFNKLRDLNSLGVIWARRENMEEVYRAADIVLSPQGIVTRSVGEPLSCGTPVIAANGCEQATWQTTASEPKKVAETIEEAINEINHNPDPVTARVKESAKAFSLAKYSESMNKLYESVRG